MHSSLLPCPALVGSEYCPGYTDILGIWTPGFYCPDGPDTAGGYLNI